MIREDVANSDVESWWTHNWGFVIGLGLILVAILVAIVCLHFRAVEQTAFEARCLEARTEILKCPEDCNYTCAEAARVKHMCMRWPDSWKGR